MKTEQKNRLEIKGWKFGSTAEFLNLSADEVAIIDKKFATTKDILSLNKSDKTKLKKN